MATIDSVTSAIKGHIRISNRTDASQFITYAISEVTDDGAYFDLQITPEAASAVAPFTNGEDVLISFVTTGDKGDTGTKGQKVLMDQQDLKVLLVIQDQLDLKDKKVK